jgi:hypothetical protein
VEIFCPQFEDENCPKSFGKKLSFVKSILGENFWIWPQSMLIQQLKLLISKNDFRIKQLVESGKHTSSHRIFFQASTLARRD